ncbi:MAG: alpha-glucosidase C-terminal domain-containing protein, partial [Saprospiraceae bacterium]
DADAYVYAFSRTKGDDRIIVVMNLSRESHTVTLRPPAEVLGAYLNLFGPSTVQVTKEMQLTLKPWEYLVLTNK